MASQLRKRERVADLDLLHAQIAPKNNGQVVGVNLNSWRERAPMADENKTMYRVGTGEQKFAKFRVTNKPTMA